MSSITQYKKEISLYAVIAFGSFAYLYAQYLGGLNRSVLSEGIFLYVTCSFWLHFLMLATFGSLYVIALKRVLNGRTRVYLALVAGTAFLLTFYLYVDTKIYSTVNLHINPFIIETLLQEDALPLLCFQLDILPN